MGVRIVFGDPDSLIHQLLLADAAAVTVQNENRLLKHSGVGTIHHNDPPGNAFDQANTFFALLI